MTDDIDVTVERRMESINVRGTMYTSPSIEVYADGIYLNMSPETARNLADWLVSAADSVEE